MTVSAPKITSAYEAYAEAMYLNPDAVRFDLIADAIAGILSKPGRQFPAIHVWMTETDPRAATVRTKYDEAVAKGVKLPKLAFKGPRKQTAAEKAASAEEERRLMQDNNSRTRHATENTALGAAYAAAAKKSAA